MTDSPEPDTVADSPEPDQEAPPVVRSEATDEFWQEVGVEPIQLALPGGQVGYTLRAYRPASQLTPTEPAPTDGDEEPDPFAERERARAAEDAAREEELLAEATAGADPETAALAGEEPAPDEFADEDGPADEEQPADEEAPVFLSHRGKLLLFSSPESLVSFLGSDAPHDLAQLDTWTTVTKRVRPADIAPNEEDVYELDLVVENLRGGHDAWDLTLLIAAGELARDVGQALRLTPVITAMAPGSPLDDLDEALRAAAAGGVGGMFARRRLRRIGAQQASLGWRTVIGKVTAAVDWRD